MMVLGLFFLCNCGQSSPGPALRMQESTGQDSREATTDINEPISWGSVPEGTSTIAASVPTANGEIRFITIRPGVWSAALAIERNGERRAIETREERVHYGWSAASTSPDARAIVAVADSVIEAPEWELEIFVSTNGGEAWRQVTNIRKPYYMADFEQLDVFDAQRFHVTVRLRDNYGSGVRTGCYRYETLDGGESWSRAIFSPIVGVVANELAGPDTEEPPDMFAVVNGVDGPPTFFYRARERLGAPGLRRGEAVRVWDANGERTVRIRQLECNLCCDGFVCGARLPAVVQAPAVVMTEPGAARALPRLHCDPSMPSPPADDAIEQWIGVPMPRFAEVGRHDLNADGCIDVELRTCDYFGCFMLLQRDLDHSDRWWISQDSDLF